MTKRSMIFEGQVRKELERLVGGKHRVYKLPDGAKRVAGDRFVHAEKMPGDFIAFGDGRRILAEAKTRGDKRLPIADNGIKPHQLQALLDWHNGFFGVFGWLIVECLAFEHEHVRLIDAWQLQEYMQANPGAKSIPLVGPDAPGTILGPPEFWKIGGKG